MKALIPGLLLALAAPLASAESAAPLPPDSQVREALLSAPAVQAALAGTESEQAAARRLDAGPYEWTVRAGMARRDERRVARYAEAELGVERGLRWWWKGRTDRRIGDAGIEAADAAVADAWHEEARGLLAQWFEVVRARALVDHLQRQSDLLEAQVRGVAVRVDSGDTRPLDLDLAQTEVEFARVRLTRARQQLELARQSLALRYPALSSDADVALPEPHRIENDPPAWTQAIVGHNHEIERAQAEAQRARLQAERARQEKIPDLTVGTRYAYERDGSERVIGLNLSLPIGSTARAAAADQLHAKAGEAEQRVRETRRKVELSAQRVATEAQASFTAWQGLEQIAVRAARNAEALQRGYQIGEAALTEVMMARRQALEAALAATQARADAWEADARLRLDAHQIWAYASHHAEADVRTGMVPATGLEPVTP